MEIKLFFKFKEQEEYIIDLKREIEEIKLKYCRDLEDINFQFQKVDFELGEMSNFVNSTSNMSENLYENNISKELGDTQNYLDQGVASIADVQKTQDIFVRSDYGENNVVIPGKMEKTENIENIDFNKLIQPAHRISLSGSKIFLPPVPLSKLNETSDELGKCIVNVCQIREFIKKVSSERENYVDNILNSYR